VGALSVWNENMRFLPDPELPAGSWELGENPYRMLQGTFGVIQGTFGMIQGTFGMIQGTFGMIQGTFDMIQGTRSWEKIRIECTLGTHVCKLYSASTLVLS
jgi:hypothetical protein